MVRVDQRGSDVGQRCLSLINAGLQLRANIGSHGWEVDGSRYRALARQAGGPNPRTPAFRASVGVAELLGKGDPEDRHPLQEPGELPPTSARGAPRAPCHQRRIDAGYTCGIHLAASVTFGGHMSARTRPRTAPKGHVAPRPARATSNVAGIYKRHEGRKSGVNETNKEH